MSKTAILFSGQGAQYVGMGKDLYDTSVNARRLFDMGESLMPGLLEVCFEGTPEQIKQTLYAQPCLFLTGLAFAEELRKRNIIADATAGFSLGEIPALAYAGVLSEEDAFRLVLVRAKAMEEASSLHEGAMAAVLKLDNAKVEALCSEFDQVWPVNYNCPGQVSCSGNPRQIEELALRVKESGGRAVMLPVSGAFHTPYMQSVAGELRSALEDMDIHTPKLSLYSDMTGEVYSDKKEDIINAVCAQVHSPVRWDIILSNMYERGVRNFVEVGAGQTLTGFVKRTFTDVNTYTVTLADAVENTCKSLLEGENL